MIVILCGLQACYDDNSKLADQPIIEVKINQTAKDSINIYFNNTFANGRVYDSFQEYL